MSPLSRRDFIKGAIAFIATYPLLGPIAEAAEIKRRKLTYGVIKAGTPALPDAAKEADALRFMVIGDWGWHGIKAAPKLPAEELKAMNDRDTGMMTVAGEMAKRGVERKPAFVFSVGDNFYYSGVKSADDPRFEITFEKPFGAPSLQIPWYACLGNHDYRSNPQAQVEYSAKSKRWRMPSRYYTFTEKAPSGITVQFFVVDTCPFHTNLHKGGHSDVAKQDTAAQLVWLEKELAASKADWKVLAGHHPIWTGGVRRDIREQDLDKILPPLMKKYGAKIYFCGHEHDSQHIERDGLHNLLVGNGGDIRPTGTTEGSVFAASRLGFGYATFAKDVAHVHYLAADGTVLHTATIPRGA